MNDEQFYDLFLLALCVWRESRGEPLIAKVAVAYTVLNRAAHPSWWGTDIVSVILKPLQYSSFNRDDPNSSRFPTKQDLSWTASLDAARKAIDKTEPDPTDGATNYFDTSISPPDWTKKLNYTVSIGAFLFYK
jgi:spore germination cell wall hydrolase CwlJ-like protein